MRKNLPGSFLEGPGRGGARLSAGMSRAGRDRQFLLLLRQKSVFGSWRRIEKRGPSSPRPSPPLLGREGGNPKFILIHPLIQWQWGQGEGVDLKHRPRTIYLNTYNCDNSRCGGRRALFTPGR